MVEWPTLDVAVRHRIGALALDVQLRLLKPWTVLFAPSGSGKTTLLRVLAGLVRAEESRIVWTPGSDARDSTSRGLPVKLSSTSEADFLPPHTRGLPMVMQNPALFPHLTVAKNVSYALERGPHPHGDRAQRARAPLALLEICRIDHLADKMPSQISGGERQRVALARALAAKGRAILLDEPFTGIDGALKADLMRDVKTWLAAGRVPALHVTHDVGEVFAVADEVIVLNEGRVAAQGQPAVVLHAERERLLASLRL